ncbi:MAG TPA: NB-ARC domain-containing protein, partial [Anaerolineales bacterium]|nr:NB-ARC domain-containing protein [Anaerolineales bacterium]
MTRTLNVFISSKMVELKEERESLYKLIPTLGREGIVLHAWEFETSAPASSDPIREVYLKALKSSALYIGLFWNEYSKPRPGVRAAIKRFIGLFWSKYREPEQPNWTIDEFNRATEERIERHIYVKVVNRRKRDPRLQRFLDKQSKVISGITWKEFKTIEELVESVKRSTDDWLNKLLVSHPGADSAIFASDADDVLERTDIKLIGRDNLVNQVNSLLDQNEQVLLQGFGGMGKTRLAKEVAVQRLANGKGPVLWLRAGDENAETVFAALARPFKRHLEIAHEVGELQIQAVRHLLKESGIKLLVLDDVWNMEALPKVMKAVPRDILMLVTSRNIDSQFRRIEIRKLERQDSLELLGLYAQKNTDKNWIKDINADILCEKVGDSPYLLKVVGKTMSESASTPVDMVQRVESTSLHMLPSAESNNEMVASVIEVSLSMLYMSGQEGKEAHRAFLSFGALFAPSATPELMALVMGENESAVNKMLYELQKLGLADEERKPGESVAYNIHELAYSYARPRSSDEQRGRVLDACLAYMKQHERLSEGDFAALLPMLRNLQGAAKWAFQDKERYAQGKKLTEMLFVGAGRGGILDLLGLASESKELMEMAAQAAAEAKKSEDRRDWQGNQGVGDQQRGDVEQAIEDHEKALNKGLVRKFMDRFLRTSRKIH